MPTTTRFAILALCAIAPVAHAEYGLGYTSTGFDPVTHQYKPIYRDWQEGVVLNPTTGNYTITYKNYGVYYQVDFEPSTKIVPQLNSSWKRDGDLIAYHYRLKSDRKSRQNIDSLQMLVSNVSTGPSSPGKWEGAAVPTFTDTRIRLSWTYNGPGTFDGLMPDRAVRGFDFDSTDLPGVGTAEIKGAAAPATWFDMPQGAIADRVNQLMDSDFVPRYAAVPWISVPTPFAFAPVLTDLQKHVDQDLVGMQLIDPALVAQLDPLFQAAIAAAQGGNTSALRGDLRALRAALSDERGQEEKGENGGNKYQVEDTGEHQEVGRDQPIAGLAKSVLEFDLRYLEQRARTGRREDGE